MDTRRGAASVPGSASVSGQLNVPLMNKRFAPAYPPLIRDVRGVERKFKRDERERERERERESPV